MKRFQEKLDFLLEKYSVENKAILKNEETVVIDGREIPTLSHRSERRFLELASGMASYYDGVIRHIGLPTITRQCLQLP